MRGSSDKMLPMQCRPTQVGARATWKSLEFLFQGEAGTARQDVHRHCSDTGCGLANRRSSRGNLGNAKVFT
ncbi:hypothetical protein DFQ28_011045, partial [Apophysomyces sp. BC1034]